MRRLFISLMLLFPLLGIAQSLKGTWSGKLNFGPSSLSVVLHINQDKDGKYQCLFDSPDQGAKGIPARIAFLSEDSLSVNIMSLVASYQGKLKDGELRGKFSQMGTSLDLSLVPGEIQLNRPQTPKPPFDYLTEEVTFTNAEDKAVLVGTLTYPLGYELKAKKRVPVVIMVSGSGLQNRDEELFHHQPFLVIADYLAKHGIASLRYDDRGVGQSKGDVANATTYHYMKDALAGIDYLRSLNKFGKVGIIGHSEGGTISFMLAGDKKVDFVASLAGTSVKGDVVLYEQNKAILLGAAVPEDVVNDYCNTLKGLLQYTVDHPQIDQPETVVARIVEESHAQLPEVMKSNLVAVLQTMNPWMRYFVGYDPLDAIKRIKCPVFAVNGSKDQQVIAATNLEALQKNLPKNNWHYIHEYPDLNHLFQHCSTGSAAEYETIEETFSMEVLKDLAEWISKIQ